MKIYFKEEKRYDYSRQGHDWVDITYSLEEMQGSCCYFVEIGDGYTNAEAENLASEAIVNALNSDMNVEEALKKLLKTAKK